MKPILSRELRNHRIYLFLLLAFSLGAILGSVSGKTCSVNLTGSLRMNLMPAIAQASFFRRLFLLLLFPTLLFAADLTDHPGLILALFFFRGFLLSAAVSACVAGAVSSVLPVLLLRAAISLPVFFDTAACLWSCKAVGKGGIRFRLIVWNLLAALCCLFAQMLLL